MNTESTLRRLFRKRITLKRRRPAADGTPRDFGVGVTGVVVTIVILGILAAIGGPPLWRLITDAREHKLNSNLQSAAQVLRDRLTLEPERMTDDVTAGVPDSDLLTVLVEDLPFTWEDSWDLTTASDDETIHVQFLDDVATSAVAPPTTAGLAPKVDWLLSVHRAVRVQSQNSDGAWACALIVMRADTAQAEAAKPSRYSKAGAPSGLTVNTEEAKRTTDAWVGGIWYDGGDSPTANDGLENCSPVWDDTTAANNDTANLPAGANDWDIGDPASGGGDPVRTLGRSL